MQTHGDTQRRTKTHVVLSGTLRVRFTGGLGLGGGSKNQMFFHQCKTCDFQSIKAFFLFS